MIAAVNCSAAEAELLQVGALTDQQHAAYVADSLLAVSHCRSRLFCAWSGMSDSVGRCDVAASLLPGDPSDQFNRQALTTARW